MTGIVQPGHLIPVGTELLFPGHAQDGPGQWDDESRSEIPVALFDILILDSQSVFLVCFCLFEGQIKSLCHLLFFSCRKIYSIIKYS